MKPRSDGLPYVKHSSRGNTAMIEEISKAVHDAALGNQKMAMFHFQVLKSAVALGNVAAESFCREIGVPETYKTEFTKMLGLARVMRQQGVRLV